MDQAEAIQDDFVPEETQETEIEAVESQDEVETTDEINAEEAEETAEPEFEEIEYNGEKYHVPPELKEAVMRHEDYTRKTQEVAEQRRSFEQQQRQFEQVVQAQRANIQGHAQLSAIESQLAQYANVDWNAASQEDPAAAQQAFFQYSQLKDAATNLSQQIQQQEAATLQQQREFRAKQLEQGKAELTRDIPGWNAELATEIFSHGESYGFSGEELRSVADPRMVKVLNDARLYRKSLKKVTEQPKPSPIKPVSKVRGKANVQKDPNKMSTDEWLKWRNKQLSQ